MCDSCGYDPDVHKIFESFTIFQTEDDDLAMHIESGEGMREILAKVPPENLYALGAKLAMLANDFVAIAVRIEVEKRTSAPPEVDLSQIPFNSEPD